MKLRIFGSNNCNDCLSFLRYIQPIADDIELEYIDTDINDDELQKFCDEHCVEQIPQVEIIDGDDEIMDTYIGTISRKEVKFMIEYWFDISYHK